jgi:hypothetical protein
MTEYLITTIDPEGYCQPSELAPDWLPVGQLLAQGWRMAALWDLEFEESMILLVRENETENQNHDG